jgi:DNA repair exonuclease SbcCD ATPase subunit
MENSTEPPAEVTADELGEYLTLRTKLRGYAKKNLQDHPPGSRDHRYVTEHKLFGTADRYHKELTDAKDIWEQKTAAEDCTAQDKAKAVNGFRRLLKRSRNQVKITEQLMLEHKYSPCDKASNEFTELHEKLRKVQADLDDCKAVKGQTTLEYFIKVSHRAFVGIEKFDRNSKDVKKLMLTDYRDNLEQWQQHNSRLRQWLQGYNSARERATREFEKVKKQMREQAIMDEREKEEAARAKEKAKLDKAADKEEMKLLKAQEKEKEKQLRILAKAEEDVKRLEQKEAETVQNDAEKARKKALGDAQKAALKKATPAERKAMQAAAAEQKAQKADAKKMEKREKAQLVVDKARAKLGEDAALRALGLHTGNKFVHTHHPHTLTHTHTPTHTHPYIID